MKLNVVRHWLENHLRAFLFGLGELFRAPVASAVTLLVIGIAMTFPAGLYTLLQNGQRLAQQWYKDPTISLYLQPHTEEIQINALIKQLRENSDIAKVDYISPEQGLRELQQQPTLQAALRVLPENPLPGIIVITPRINLQFDDSQNLLSSLRQLPYVDASQLDTLWMKRIYELMTLGQRITYGLMLLFGIGVALIVGNTMRMATQSHRQEIRVLRLVGATPAFIRRPMLYRGALYGMLGGMLACLLVNILFWWLESPAELLAESYNDQWRLQGPSYFGEFAMITVCALLGLMGAWFSVQHHLQTPEGGF